MNNIIKTEIVQNSRSINDHLTFCFGKSKPNSRWYNIVIDKGFYSLSNSGVLPVIIFSGIISLFVWKFEYVYELIIFKILFLMMFIISVLDYINIVIEVQIDEEYLYIRKYRKFVKISWNDIKYIRSFRIFLSGVTILWIKPIKSFGGYLYFFGALSHEEQFKILSDLLSEIKRKRGRFT